MDQERSAAVERLTELLERDVIDIDAFNALVARTLESTTPTRSPSSSPTCRRRPPRRRS